MEPTNPASLQHHAIPGVAEILPGNGNLPVIRITTAASSAEIYLHGAHVTSWKPANSDEVIFLSQQTKWEPDRAIRGGIPVCYPWFRAKSDNPKAPAHGFVRTTEWQLDSITHQGDSVTVTLSIASSESTRQWWPHDFRLTHRITVGAALHLELITANTGTGPFQIEEALHTYHRVGEVEKTSVHGLDGVTFLDNRDNNAAKLQQGALLMTGPTDNAYLNTTGALEISDPVLGRRVRIEKENSLTTVAWNPWSEGAKSMSDMGDEEWHQMICVEASNILGAAVTVAPGAEHTMAAKIHVIAN